MYIGNFLVILLVTVGVSQSHSYDLKKLSPRDAFLVGLTVKLIKNIKAQNTRETCTLVARYKALLDGNYQLVAGQLHVPQPKDIEICYISPDRWEIFERAWYTMRGEETLRFLAENLCKPLQGETPETILTAPTWRSMAKTLVSSIYNTEEAVEDNGEVARLIEDYTLQLREQHARLSDLVFSTWYFPIAIFIGGALIALFATSLSFFERLVAISGPFAATFMISLGAFRASGLARRKRETIACLLGICVASMCYYKGSPLISCFLPSAAATIGYLVVQHAMEKLSESPRDYMTQLSGLFLICGSFAMISFSCKDQTAPTPSWFNWITPAEDPEKPKPLNVLGFAFRSLPVLLIALVRATHGERFTTSNQDWWLRAEKYVWDKGASLTTRFFMQWDVLTWIAQFTMEAIKNPATTSAGMALTVFSFSTLKATVMKERLSNAQARFVESIWMPQLEALVVSAPRVFYIIKIIAASSMAWASYLAHGAVPMLIPGFSTPAWATAATTFFVVLRMSSLAHLYKMIVFADLMQYLHSPSWSAVPHIVIHAAKFAREALHQVRFFGEPDLYNPDLEEHIFTARERLNVSGRSLDGAQIPRPLTTISEESAQPQSQQPADTDQTTPASVSNHERSIPASEPTSSGREATPSPEAEVANRESGDEHPS